MSTGNITSQHIASLAGAILEHFKQSKARTSDEQQIERIAASAVSQAKDPHKHTSHEIASLAGHILRNAQHYTAAVRGIAASVLEQAKR